MSRSKEVRIGNEERKINKTNFDKRNEIAHFIVIFSKVKILSIAG